MGNANTKKLHIDRAEKTGVLQLKGAGVRDVPTDVLKLRKNLRNLDLSGNKIEFLPSFVGEFLMLKQLVLDQNRLACVPEELGNLSKLEVLSLTGNFLVTVPETLAGLTNLKSLNLSQNRLNQFPDFICYLKKLDNVDLSGNKIEVVPPEIGQLSAIELNLNQNRVNTLSDEIATCSRLKVLRLEENCLSLDSMSPRILVESNISLLAVEGNLFDVKDFRQADGYDKYMERYTATKRKMY